MRRTRRFAVVRVAVKQTSALASGERVFTTQLRPLINVSSGRSMQRTSPVAYLAIVLEALSCTTALRRIKMLAPLLVPIVGV